MSRIIIALDTATPAVTAAVVSHDTTQRCDVLAQQVTVNARAHAELLTPNVVSALVQAGMQMSDLDAVVVGCGPGPFTGLRVGIATAVAFGQALDVPVYGVCSLDAIGVNTAGEVLVVTDARRREVYWARYRDGIRLAGPGVNAPGDVPVSGAQHVAGSAEHAAHFALPYIGPEYPSAEGLVAAVHDWVSTPDPIVPLYLRRPDAKTCAERNRDMTAITP